MHDEMACNEKEQQICKIVDLLVIATLMLMIEEQGKHSGNVFMSFSFDFLLLLFVFNALFLVMLCLLLVARLKLPHVLLFSSLYFWCIVLIILGFSSCCQVNILCFVDFIFGVLVFSFCH
jgi:hypothetical protein